MSLLVGTVVAYAAYPAGRVKAHINILTGEKLAQGVARLLSLLTVATGVAAGKCLDTVTGGLIAVAGRGGDSDGVAISGDGVLPWCCPGSVSERLRLGGVFLRLF